MFYNLTEHPQAIFEAGERGIQTDEDVRWDRFVRNVEKLAADRLHRDHTGLPSLDGDQFTDGYSLDFASDAFDRGVSAEEYAASIPAR